jgi:hypothetical protein
MKPGCILLLVAVSVPDMYEITDYAASVER